MRCGPKSSVLSHLLSTWDGCLTIGAQAAFGRRLQRFVRRLMPASSGLKPLRQRVQKAIPRVGTELAG